MYRQERNYENLNNGIFEGTGDFDIPSLNPIQLVDTKEFIGFNYAKTCKIPLEKGVHFFVDDYQFTRVWNQPNNYLELLARFSVVCTPDFSTYTDFPRAIQIYNHYRKHWLGAYWQRNGITVIPTISWSDEKSFDWCFDGEPVGGAVAVSSVGTQLNAQSKELFLLGYSEMLKRLKPSQVVFYGRVPEACMADNVLPILAFQEKHRQKKAGT